MPRPSLSSGYKVAPGQRWPFLLLAVLLLLALVSAGFQVVPTAKAADEATASSSAAEGQATTAGRRSTTTSTAAPATTTSTAAPTTTAAPAPVQIISNTCDDSQLQRHDGFQNAPRCVATDHGEVAAATPAVLLSRFPRVTRAGQAFQVIISTRNLVRDRFLAAAAGGYYAERSILDGNGITRGHLHVYVQALSDGSNVPDADANPLEFFQAVEDGGGGAGLSRLTVSIGALTAGPKRLCVTMGDASHRVPMQRAARLAAGADCVRMFVR